MSYFGNAQGTPSSRSYRSIARLDSSPNVPSPATPSAPPNDRRRRTVIATCPPPPSPCQSVTSGPAHSATSHGAIAGTGANCHSPGRPSGGRWVTGPLAMHSQPSGTATDRVIVAVRSDWSKQQKTPGALDG